MLSLYNWLDKWGKTPTEMGVPLERLDPRYWDAMQLLRVEYSKLDNSLRERARPRSRPPDSKYPGM